ncbi:MAG: hypothetical protein MHPSP_003914, partial [Paramarteilia canceri]
NINILPALISGQTTSSGWNIFTWEKELDRWNLDKSFWIVSELNSDYTICTLYPKTLILPKKLSKHDLSTLSNCREEFQFPALIWSDNETFLFRCSKVSEDYEASIEAEEIYIQYLKALSSAFNEIRVYYTCVRPNKNDHNLASPALPLDSTFFMNLPDFNRIRAYYEEFFDKLVNEFFKSNIHTVLKATDWIKSSLTFLEKAIDIAKDLKNTKFVVYVCGNGKNDRVPLITSLVQLMIDPYYRTIEGFY